MFPLSNVHTHTVFSDGASTVDKTVRTAIQKGFTSLGFSDHGTSHDPAGMGSEALYCSEVRRAQKKYTDQIEIALGVEHEAFTEEADLSLYDYVIESVHFLYNDSIYTPIDYSADVLQQAIERYYGGDAYAMCRDYFERVNSSMLHPKADIVGHIGLVSKFNETQPLFDQQNPRYLQYASQTIALAAEKNLLVEINSGAMSRGYRSAPYPDLEQLKLLLELGGRITITSDCHRAEWLDFGMEKSRELAKAAGFREAWIWENGVFIPKEL